MDARNYNLTPFTLWYSILSEPNLKQCRMDEKESQANRIIMHIDMDAFYASVEQRDHPELRGKPIVVGASPMDRGVVSAASYEARKYGIRSAMSMAQALRLCSNVIRRPPNFKAYKEASEIIHYYFQKITPEVEPVSLDEAYLDVTGLMKDFAHASAIGRSLKRDIRISTQLVASVGIGPNKFLAKVASDYDKPDGFFVIKPDDVLDFLLPLSVRALPGVGKKTEMRLSKLSIHTIERLRECRLDYLQNHLGGKHGLRLYELARGIDNNPVIPTRIRKSLSQEHTFSHDLGDKEKMKEFLRTLSSEVADLLDKKQLKGRTIGIKVRFNDFRIATRSYTINEPTNDSKKIAEVAVRLLDRVEFSRKKVRLLGVRVAGFETSSKDKICKSDEDIQLTFW